MSVGYGIGKKGTAMQLRLAIAALAATFATGGSVSAATLSISCGAVGQELTLCQDGVKLWMEQNPDHTVNVVSTPNSATERLALYQQILAAGAADIDVYQIDVIWPGILASHFIDLSEYIDKETVDQNFEAIVANNTVDGQLVAMPWFTDAGVLYYRTDLLEKYGYSPPETWQDLTEIAKDVMEQERAGGNDKMQGFVFQAAAYEGLTCNALEWVNSFGGGTIVDEEGQATINNPQAIEALTAAAGWINTVAPQGVLNYQEEESRGVFQSGNAVFMRNWPYAWALANSPDSAVKDKVGVVELPMGAGDGARHSATLGGWQLAVSKYSPNAEVAASLVKFLTSAEEQKRRAVEGAYNPTIASLYEDPEVLEANPFFGKLYGTFTSAVARPSSQAGARYNQVSSEFYNAVHSVLSGSATPDQAIGQLERKLARLIR